MAQYILQDDACSSPVVIKMNRSAAVQTNASHRARSGANIASARRRQYTVWASQYAMQALYEQQTHPLASFRAEVSASLYEQRDRVHVPLLTRVVQRRPPLRRLRVDVCARVEQRSRRGGLAVLGRLSAHAISEPCPWKLSCGGDSV